MTLHDFIQAKMVAFVMLSHHLLVPLFVLTLMTAFLCRVLIYFTMKRQEWFAREFEKRVDAFIDNNPAVSGQMSFLVITKKLLEKTFYEVFENRSRFSRRRSDPIMSMSDRAFLVKQGSARLVRDLQKQIQNIKFSNNQPKFLNVTRTAYSNNGAYTRLLGYFPIASINDFVNTLPGLFVICGILGTFLGVMKGLPELGGMNLSDPEQTKLVMDQFLTNISFAMVASIVGIMSSVVTTIFNTLMDPEKVYMSMMERFESSLDSLWHRCTNNDVPTSLSGLTQTQDPHEVLAEEAVLQELGKRPTGRDDLKVLPKKGA